MACNVTDAFGCLGFVGRTVAGDAFSSVANAFGRAAKDCVGWLWQTMGAATAVRLGGPGWGRDLGITVSLALVVGTSLFLIQVAASALRRDLAGIGRAGRGLVVGAVAGGMAIGITNLLLAATDSIADGIMKLGTGGGTWQSMGAKLLDAQTFGGLAAGSALLLLISLVAIMASMIVWAALMVRKLLIIVAAVFTPVAFAGSVADITVGWVRKWVELTVALISSKIILTVIFVVGLGVLDNGVGQVASGGAVGRASQSITQAVTGCLILCIAGFAPWLAIKLVHFAGDSFERVHHHAADVASASRQAVASPQKVSRLGQQLGRNLGGNHSGNNSGQISQRKPTAQTGEPRPDGPSGQRSPRPDPRLGGTAPTGRASTPATAAVVGKAALTPTTAPLAAAEAATKTKQTADSLSRHVSDVANNATTEGHGPAKQPPPPPAK